MSIEVHAYQNCQCDSFNFFWGELKFSLNLSSLPIEASFLFVLWLCHGACGILVPWPGIKPESSVAKAESLNHCTTREFPESRFLTYLFSCVCVCACALGCVPLFVTPWTAALPGSVHGISQARILEWIAISSSRGSSRPRDPTCISWISFIGRWILYHWATWEALIQL